MATAKRTERTPINGVRSRLGVKGKEAGFHYRIVNDDENDRVSLFLDAGYEVVTSNGVSVGDKRVATPTKEGTPVKISVGGGKQAYLMRIREDWYKEDQEAKQKQIAELEEGMKQKAKDSFYGDIKT